MFLFTDGRRFPIPVLRTGPIKGSYEEPAEWGTINQQTSALGIKTVTKASASHAHSGSYAVKLTTYYISFFARTAPGITATGTINQQTQSIDGGFACTQRPSSLTGWYQYFPGGSDTASVEVILSCWDSVTNRRITVGHGIFTETDSIAGYTSFEALINYSSSLPPDTAVIVLMASSSTDPVDGSTLYADDLSFTLSAGNSNPAMQNPVSVFPNPASPGFYVHCPGIEGEVFMEVFDVLGNEVDRFLLNPGTEWHPADNYPDGIYLYRITDADNTLLKPGKLIIQKSK